MALWIPKRLVEISLINSAAQNDIHFVTHCEIEYESRVTAAALEIISHGKKVVMLTGPSSSGKTTTANKIAKALNNMGREAVVVSLDNFYKNIEVYPRLPDGSNDYENVTALDVPHINKCLGELIEKGSADFPIFDFVVERRSDKVNHIDLPEDGVCIVEGIHALNPALIESLPQDKIYKIYAGLREEYSHKGQRILPTRDIRLVRRMIRDYKYRGHSVQKTLDMWGKVCEGEDKYIKIFKPEANLLLDTSFSYEISLLASYMKEISDIMKDEEISSPELKKLIETFEICDKISGDIVPKDSMLREFIG